jgi:transposase
LALENRIIKQQHAASERLTARAMEREAAERAAQTKLTQIEAAFQIVGRGDELHELMDAYHAKRLPQQQVQRSTRATENDLTPQQIGARARARDDGWER